MRRCPTCNKTFSDQNLSFCVEDGTPLVAVEPLDDGEETIVNPPDSGASAGGGGSAPVYQPPGSYVPPGGKQPRQKAWPWVLGFLAVGLLLLVGVGIAAAIVFPKLRAASNREVNANADRPANVNSNLPELNSNTNESEGNARVDEDAPAPTDEERVLSALTDLENEWTVANINADKKALDRILADDYVSDVEGRQQRKAEYLKTIKRDQTIERWKFEDLQLSLKGNRATLGGVVRFQVRGQEAVFRFTDKFVWRDGRWQATGSELSRLE